MKNQYPFSMVLGLWLALPLIALAAVSGESMKQVGYAPMQVEVSGDAAKTLVGVISTELGVAIRPEMSVRSISYNTGLSGETVNCYVQVAEGISKSLSADGAAAVYEVLNAAENMLFRNSDNHLSRDAGEVIMIQSLVCSPKESGTRCVITYNTGGAAGGAMSL